MTDDEVMQWLSDKERDRWMECGRYAEAPLWVEDVLRSLAETRRALAACEWATEDDLEYHKCPLCGGYQFGNGNGIGGHFARCIFTTMPRPK